MGDFRLLTLLALAPAFLILMFIWKMDKKEKEPVKLLAQLAGLGALTTISAIIIELALDLGLTLTIGSENLVYYILDNYLVIALAEEGGKYLVMRLRTWKSPEFDFSYDAVVYAAASSLGFAAVENILYVFQGGIVTGILRAITSIPGHAIFAVFMGWFYGKAKRCHFFGDHSGEVRNHILALVVPIFVHGTYDFILTINEATETLLPVLFFVLFDIAITVVAILLIFHLSKNDSQVGLIAPKPQPVAVGYPSYPPYPGAGQYPAYPQYPNAAIPQTPAYPQYPNTAVPQTPAYPQYPNTAAPQTPTYPQYPNTAVPQNPAYPQYPNTAVPQKPVYPQYPNTAAPQTPTYPQYPNTAAPQTPTYPQYPNTAAPQTPAYPQYPNTAAPALPTAPAPRQKVEMPDVTDAVPPRTPYQ